MFVDRERTRARGTADLMPELARRFLAGPEPPTRLPTVRELAGDLHASGASIHLAIGALVEARAIEVRTRGRLGTFLIGRAVGRLWAAAERGPLIISLPLASSPRYEALATAIKQLLTRAGVEVFLIFVRGSRQRLQAILDGRCHLAVMSAFAAGELCGPEEQVVLALGPNSYNTGHRVFLSPGYEDGRPARVIVDQHSVDQQRLTALEFTEPNVQFQPATTPQITSLLESGQADAAVWTVDEMQVRRPIGLLDRALRPEVQAQLGDRDTRAVLVGARPMAPMLATVTASIDSAAVTRIEADVIGGRIVPEY